MALSPREAFKVGFLLACADQGLSGEQVKDRIEKAAAFTKIALLGMDVGDAAGSIGKYTALAGVGLPIAAGAGAGYLAHRALRPELDEDDVKKQELIEELRHYARRAKEQQKVKTLRTSLGA